MKTIPVDTHLVAFCGLYCGACRAYAKGRCPGCPENHRARWCQIRTCCLQKNIATCAECEEVRDAADCHKFNTVISRIFSLIFRSDRAACIRQIKELGLEGHAANMARNHRQTIRR